MIDTTYFEGIGIALISACYGTKTSTSNVPLSNKKIKLSEVKSAKSKYNYLTIYLFNFCSTLLLNSIEWCHGTNMYPYHFSFFLNLKYITKNVQLQEHMICTFKCPLQKTVSLQYRPDLNVAFLSCLENIVAHAVLCYIFNRNSYRFVKTYIS